MTAKDKAFVCIKRHLILLIVKQLESDSKLYIVTFIIDSSSPINGDDDFYDTIRI